MNTVVLGGDEDRSNSRSQDDDGTYTADGAGRKRLYFKPSDLAQMEFVASETKGIDGGLSISKAGTAVTFTRDGTGSPIKYGTQCVLVLINVRTPPVSGVTAVYLAATFGPPTTGSGGGQNLLDMDPKVPGSPILGPNPVPRPTRRPTNRPTNVAATDGEIHMI